MIMEVTRRLDQPSKSSVKGFCDKMLFYKKKQEVQENSDQAIPSLKDYHHTNYNPQRVTTVKDLPFSEKHIEWLIDIYKLKTADFQWKDGETEEQKQQKAYKFIDYYYEQLKLVCEQEEKFKKGLENRGSNNLGAASELANEEHITKELEASQEYFLQDMGQKESPNQFFLKLIQTFDKQINFYNLLFFSEDM